MARLQYSRYLRGHFYRPRFKLEIRGDNNNNNIILENMF